MSELNSGTSMRSQRPSRTTTGNLIPSTFSPTADRPISDALPLIQDGGNCSDLMVLSSETSRTTKLLKYKAD
jgi:hypothetical protein